MGPIRLPPDWQIQRVHKALSQSVDWSHGFFGLDEEFYAVDCSTVTLGVADTGIDTRHPDIKIEKAVDFTSTDPGDAQGHGTWCGGYCCAIPNDIGTIGITGNKKTKTVARLHSIKVLGNDGSGSSRSLYNGFEYAIDSRLDVLSCSWGGGGPDQHLLKLIQAYIAGGGFPFFAAGNSSGGGRIADEDYPAKFPGVPGIAAVGKNGKLTDFSSYGPGVLCCAPGYQMLAPIPGGYGLMSGTSMATPAVAGIACKLLAATLAAGLPRPTLNEMGKMIQDRARIVGGLRIIDPKTLIHEVKKAPKPPPVNTPGTEINIGIGKVRFPARAGDWLSIGPA